MPQVIFYALLCMFMNNIHASVKDSSNEGTCFMKQKNSDQDNDIYKIIMTIFIVPNESILPEENKGLITDHKNVFSFRID